MATTEKIELAWSLVGKKVRFRHDPPGVGARLVTEATSDGMIEIEGFGGQFAPHLFAVDPESKAEYGTE